METLLSSLIQLFGTISALALTFLILLYESAKRVREGTRKHVSDEVQNALKCRYVQARTQVIEGNELHTRLVEQCRSGRVDEGDVENMIGQLHSSVHTLRTDGLEAISPEEAGHRAQAAAHLEKYHERDTATALAGYQRAIRQFETFNSRTRQVVGIPLLVTAIFILFLMDIASGASLIPSPLCLALTLLVTLSCLTFIFLAVTRALKELYDIDR